jgi:uncharacterized delta-60 repeat protein
MGRRLSVLVVWCLVAIAAGAPSAIANPGDLDTTFGDNGIVTTRFGTGDEFVHAVEIQPDARILVGGEVSGLYGLARLDPDGSLDGSFGFAGRLVIPIRSPFGSFFGRGVQDLALQSDGKIIVIGTGPDQGFLLARFETDGERDLTFGGDGIVVTELGEASEGHAVEVLDDGRIIAAGVSGYQSDDERHAIVARYETDGSLDGTFGTGGTTILDLGTCIDDAGASDVGLQSDGEVVVVGKCFESADYSFIARLDLAGVQQQWVPVPFDPYNPQMTVQVDDSVVVAGATLDRRRMRITRYTSTLDPDPAFDTVTTPVGCATYPGAIAVQPDGKVVVGGITSRRAFDGISIIRRFGLLRYSSDGTLDPSFGRGGRVETSVGIGAGFTVLDAVAIQDDGAIVAGGSAQGFDEDVFEFTMDFTLARYVGVGPGITVGYQPDGAIALPRKALTGDDVYGSTGVGQTVTTSARPGEARRFSVRIQNDGTGVDCMIVAAPRRGLRFSAQFFAEGRDVTGPVAARVYPVRDRDPGESGRVRVEVRVGATAKPGTVVVLLITARSAAEPAIRDVVRARIRVLAA